MSQPLLYTIGHSTHSIEAFSEMLQSFGIQRLVDIRRFPGSKKYPHFNKENLERALEDINISYAHLEDLGGRRKPHEQSKNTRWNNASFRGYADYMETLQFKNAAKRLGQMAMDQPIAIMCSEAVWWRCHRSLVSDYMRASGWKIMHILSKNKSQEHPYTKPARIINGRVCYYDELDELNLFSSNSS
ncbi:MAG: hypothetical protein K0R26_2779 [Bacteroidota bacterium]|jgi:uncharacterized protein (DUF488 family)|nr:hypothetical protein [Bacteroidota bacterium]